MIVFLFFILFEITSNKSFIFSYQLNWFPHRSFSLYLLRVNSLIFLIYKTKNNDSKKIVNDVPQRRVMMTISRLCGFLYSLEMWGKLKDFTTGSRHRREGRGKSVCQLWDGRRFESVQSLCLVGTGVGRLEFQILINFS